MSIQSCVSRASPNTQYTYDPFDISVLSVQCWKRVHLTQLPDGSGIRVPLTDPLAGTARELLRLV